MSAPTHHLPGGGFGNPWPGAGASERGFGDFLRWQLERAGAPPAPSPAPGSLPRGESRIARPRAGARELRVTWVGHSTLLVQVGGLNLLTDPVWSQRASPVRWAGPARLMPPGVAWEDLPDIDAVLISHDHYDHLDRETVARLHGRFGERLRWLAPLGFAAWFAPLGIRTVTELDWWHEATLAPASSPGTAGAGPGPDSGGDGRAHAGAGVRVVATPAQHWSRRSPLEGRRDRLWCSWVLHSGDARLYFGGDTGFFPEFPEIGSRYGPFDVVALPIGAYAPRWFMRAAHMDPEEAVQAYVELGGRGALLPIHWGTFRLTDEPLLEPPELLRKAWGARALPDRDLALLPHGGTLVAR